MPGKYTNAAMAAAEAKEAAAQAGLGDDTANSSNVNNKSSKNVFARFTPGAAGGGRDRGSDGDEVSRVESDYDPSILSGYTGMTGMTGMTGVSGAGTAYSEVSESVISDADYTRSTLGGGDDATAGGHTVESDTYGAASGYSRSPPASPTRARSSASKRSTATERRGTGRRPMNDEDEDDHDVDDGAGGDWPRIQRYRGFSTSISSLFLDESLVCGAISCFGLILSQRSEHLLNVRNEARGLVQHGGNGRKSGAIRKPSKVVGLALIVTLVGMAATYAYWGFGNKYEGSSGISSYYDFFDDGYDGGASAGNGVYYANDDAAAAGGSVNDDDAAGDDRYHNQNMYYGDDNWRNRNNNNYNNNNAYAADDDGGNNYGANDDAVAAGDDQYYNRYNGNRRDLEDNSWSTTTQPHNIGICKVRDAQHYLWQPLYGLLDDTVREQHEQMTVEGQKHPDQTRMLQYDYEDAGPRVVDTGTWIRLGLGIAFLVVLGLIGRRRRMRTRYEILRARAQDDHLFYSSSIGGKASMDEEVENGREDKYEGACSHTLCGCYPVDENLPEDDDDDDDGGADDDTFAHIANDTNPGKKIRKNRKGTDCMARFFSCVSACCCGWVCKIWIQCFSICALAQEGREVRLLLPPRLQRVDILTHQPWYEYYRDIYNLRLKWMAQNRDKKRNARGFEIGPHFRALSQLSRIMITLFIICTIAIVLVLQLNPRATFDWGDVFVLVATFLQSFIVLFIVHWIFHKSDLSFDAVVKFYASGFLIATPTAFIAEGILINIMLFVAYTLYAIGAVIWEEDFLDWISQNYVPFWIAGELLNAFIVAAITEELCKYYAFRFVEHPDLIFLTGLDRARQDSDHLIGGEKNYAFNSHVVSSDLHTGSEFDLDRSVAAGFSQKKNMHRGKRTQARTAMSMSLNPDDTGTDEEEVRSIRQRAAAITTAMIGTAVGLACAENFLYVFMFGGANSGTEEMAILIFRSIFPIHALAAAMQSIGVIRKFLEGPGDRDAGRLGVGKIIFPAVLLHGTFDAILMSVNVYIESSWDFYMRENNGEVAEGFVPYNSFVVNLVVWIAICTTMFAGLVWYTMKNREQKKRLAMLEDTEDRVMELANMGDGTRKSPRTYVNPTLGENADGDGGGEFV